MFSSLGWGEIMTLGVLALLIFGPERLPTIAAQAGRAIRQFRNMASGATEELRREMGVEDLREELRRLDPRRMLDDDEPAPGVRPNLAPGEPAPFDPDTT